MTESMTGSSTVRGLTFLCTAAHGGLKTHFLFLSFKLVLFHTLQKKLFSFLFFFFFFSICGFVSSVSVRNHLCRTLSRLLSWHEPRLRLSVSGLSQTAAPAPVFGKEGETNKGEEKGGGKKSGFVFLGGRVGDGGFPSFFTLLLLP